MPYIQVQVYAYTSCMELDIFLHERCNPITPTSATSFSTASFQVIDGTNHFLYVRMAWWVITQKCYIS